MKSRRFVLALALFGAAPILAQDPFEIQVYLYNTVPKGFWNLETHLNTVVRGDMLSAGPVAPTEGQTHLTLELTRGITDHFEMAGYLVTSTRRGVAGEYVAWRFRPRFRVPEGKLPFKFSLALESAFLKNDTYEPADITLEIRPIFEWNMGKVLVAANPTVGKSLKGPGSDEALDFEPGVHIGYPASDKLELSLEYYGGTGEITDPLPFKQQVHQFFPGFDYRFNPETIFNFGVGFGATNVGNSLVVKMRFGKMF
jgi:hypothetical protein